MIAPQLTRHLTLEEPQRIADMSGGFRVTWVAVGQLWADPQPQTGKERGGEFVTLASVPWQITVRGAPAGSPSRPNPGQRFRDGSRVFLIRAVAEADPRGAYLICFAIEESVK